MSDTQVTVLSTPQNLTQVLPGLVSLTEVLTVQGSTSQVLPAAEAMATVLQPQAETTTTTVTPATPITTNIGGIPGPKGDKGDPGTGGGGAGTFIFDITSTGVVSDKFYKNEPNILFSCATDTSVIRVHVGCEGDALLYKPTMTVNGVSAILTESTTTRWFTGYADIVLVTGENLVIATSSTGTTAQTFVTLMGAGPAVQSIAFGGYPGSQTELKYGDTISITVNTDVDAVSVDIVGGSTTSSHTFLVSGGVATGSLSILSGSGTLTIVALAKNAFGTFGEALASPALTLSQSTPTFGTVGVTYPAGKSALGVGDSADVTCLVSDYDTIGYVCSLQSIAQTYDLTKTVTNSSSAYVATGTNYTITAVRAANNSTASASALVKVASVAPTAAITILTNPPRLSTSPSGTDYEIRLTPTQPLSSSPSLASSAGTWQGSWVLSGSYWKRNLRVFDADLRGVQFFSSLSLTNQALVAGSTITSGAAFTIGGLSVRTLTFAAFQRVTAIGGQVLDRTKTSAAIAGGNTLNRFDDNLVHSNGYYLADVDGSYNPVGTYLGLSDSAFAGSNTSGTLQATFQETQ